MARADFSARFVRGAPTVEEAVRGLRRRDAGALAVLAPTARDVGLVVQRLPAAPGVFRRALREGRSQGALAARIRHGTGRIPAGAPMVVVAAAAQSRQDALVSVQAMLNALKGVAVRRDASRA